MALRDVVSYLISAVDKTRAATESAKANLNGLRTSYEGVQRSMQSLSRLSLGFISVAGVKAGTLAIVDTRVELERMRNTLAQGVGAQNLAAELLFVRKTADDFGQSLGDVSSAYSRFAAATRGTSLEGAGTREVFLGISTAATTLGLSAEQLGGALTAVQQIVSKGKVSAEELRGQLGERLPGAFQIAARSIGVTTTELDRMLAAGELLAEDFLPKFAAQLRTEFAGGLEAASQSAGAAVNRLSTAWLELKQDLAQSPVGDAAIAGINLLTRAIAQLNDEAAARDFGLKPGLLGFGGDTLQVARALRTDPGSLGEARLRREGGADETVDAAESLRRSRLKDRIADNEQTRIANTEWAKLAAKYQTAAEKQAKIERNIRATGVAARKSEEEIGKLIAASNEQAQNKQGKKAESIRRTKLKSDIDAIRNELDRLVGAYANANSLLDAERQANLVSEEDYFETKKSYIRLQADIQQNALEAENKALAAYKATGKERIDLDRQIADNVAAIAKLRADASNAEQIVGIQQSAAARKTARDWEEARAAAQAYIDTLNRGYRRDLDAIGLGDAERQRQAGRSQIEDRYSQQRQQLESERRSGAFDQRPGEYEKQLGLIREFQGQALADWDRYYGELKAKQADSSLGFSEAIANYVDQARDQFSQIEQLTTNAFQSIEDAFVNFAKTGKLSFKQLADSVIADLSRILVRKALLNLLAGFAGQTAYGASIGLPASGPPLATGTNYVPFDGFRATLHRGEAVVPAKYNPAAGGAGGGVVINQTVNISGGEGGGGVDQRRLAQMVGEIAVAKIVESQRRNGLAGR